MSEYEQAWAKFLADNGWLAVEFLPELPRVRRLWEKFFAPQ